MFPITVHSHRFFGLGNADSPVSSIGRCSIGEKIRKIQMNTRGCHVELNGLKSDCIGSHEFLCIVTSDVGAEKMLTDLNEDARNAICTLIMDN